jgi:hypothetical protein
LLCVVYFPENNITFKKIDWKVYSTKWGNGYPLDDVSVPFFFLYIKAPNESSV